MPWWGIALIGVGSAVVGVVGGFFACFGLVCYMCKIEDETPKE